MPGIKLKLRKLIKEQSVIRGVKARISRAAHQNGIPFGWQTRFYDLLYGTIGRIE